MVLLSFDIEEFDLPSEYGFNFDFEKQMEVSSQGILNILNILDSYGVDVTFFSTLNFFTNLDKSLQMRIVNSTHELASHGVSHSSFCDDDYKKSKTGLENIAGKEVRGFRMARMAKVDMSLLKSAGYVYDSSINPTYLPGRYNNFSFPRLPYINDNGIYEMPSSVTPVLRIPLFWLSAHNMPVSIYRWLLRKTHSKDFYINIYFHPWEFVDLSLLDIDIPYIIRHNSGLEMQKRLSGIIKMFLEGNVRFSTISDFINCRKELFIK